MDETENQHVKWNKPDTERQALHIFLLLMGSIWIKNMFDVEVEEGLCGGKKREASARKLDF